MSQKVISLRISSALLDRLDQMVDLLKHDPKRSPRGNLTRAEVIRESIIRGCDLLEQEDRPSLSPRDGWGGTAHHLYAMDDSMDGNADDRSMLFAQEFRS
ncbi:MAG: hypothetical protein HQL60_06080 [Magnetococcales bacterium]|nr:hypothetical protein [Magnetococcales bacterium]